MNTDETNVTGGRPPQYQVPLILQVPRFRLPSTVVERVLHGEVGRGEIEIPRRHHHLVRS